MKKHSLSDLNEAFKLLNERLELNDITHFNLVVCGGTSLIATKLVERTTKDVDVVAFIDETGNLADPEPMPESLLKEVKAVASNLGLDENWLNNGPSKGDGGLFRSGLPEGFASRLIKNEIGSKLTLYFISRLDQIHFKLFASVDRFGGYHTNDLMQLNPADDEILMAAEWSMTQDPSEGYKMMLKKFLEHFGYGHLCEKI